MSFRPHQATYLLQPLSEILTSESGESFHRRAHDPSHGVTPQTSLPPRGRKLVAET
jgi:hypothetical protein